MMSIGVLTVSHVFQADWLTRNPLSLIYRKRFSLFSLRLVFVLRLLLVRVLILTLWLPAISVAA